MEVVMQRRLGSVGEEAEGEEWQVTLVQAMVGRLVAGERDSGEVSGAVGQ